MLGQSLCSSRPVRIAIATSSYLGAVYYYATGSSPSAWQVWGFAFMGLAVLVLAAYCTSSSTEDHVKVVEKTSNINGTNLPDPDPIPYLTPETVETYEDRPWRPFRWPYHQTMSLFKLDINHWLDMDRWAARYYREAEHEIENRGKDVGILHLDVYTQRRMCAHP